MPANEPYLIDPCVSANSLLFYSDIAYQHNEIKVSQHESNGALRRDLDIYLIFK